MSTRSPRGRSPIPSHQDRAPSRSMRSRSPQSPRPRSISSRSPSQDRRDRRSRSRSSSRGRSGRRNRSPSYSRSPSRDVSPPRSAKCFEISDFANQEEQIVVEKLTKNVTEAHLREIFGSFGDIEHLDLPMNRTYALSHELHPHHPNEETLADLKWVEGPLQGGAGVRGLANDTIPIDLHRDRDHRSALDPHQGKRVLVPIIHDNVDDEAPVTVVSAVAVTEAEAEAQLEAGAGIGVK
ncbi:Serine/arginine-rich splicing factor SR45 [Penicillium angulare]|uniref:Serine/arginine-rich splicing factor SR45 n=1 Tax=Penicillium angulare TaxID=116970 RepID=UPI002541BA84|nr:Serine/arginine-rich splicing factor SR45 [Penicillium angulare]KAJ5273947.1 Serine/arginine-rich splicing factor SR45 [Penicillium angulare]